ncbi:hypothetical protein DYBT9275_03039 [Dyadobacter sp. CECT 9275]|uniref:Outer membrane protein beta-barrel domain-containing protein n=1 Tax=Dyadobacter helix TaxID=2822344 RepID=A0A916NC89_9BACT|nr:hypothetical protein [Dyadobacter sp. CECT 9275]CAG5003056.1 hypothetical protein DYBT9275_03039 [Dyadobacter sp. CECT 9275]
MCKINVWFLALVLLTGSMAQAQEKDYNGGENALGIRAGGTTGITFKKFFNKKTGLELIGGYNFDNDIKNVSMTALFEKHAPLIGDRFAAFIGAGPSYVFSGSNFGASATLGFDMRLGKTPLNFQIDWMPSYYFTNGSHFSPDNGGLSIRYILNHKKLYQKE